MSELAVIKEIEKLIGEELTTFSSISEIMPIGQQNCYWLNSHQQVTGLKLYNCNISTIDWIKKLPNLTQLNLSENKISDISAFKNLPKLTLLYLWNNQVSDISVLKNLSKLTELHLGGNRFSDISALKNLSKLTVLYLWRNQLSDISVLKNLPNLKKLSLLDNQLSDISDLKNLHNLKWLDLSDNKLIDLPEWLLNFNIPIKWDSDYSYSEDDSIYLNGNPLEEPPPELIALGNKAIKAYFDGGKRNAINEVKIIVVIQTPTPKIQKVG